MVPFDTYPQSAVSAVPFLHCLTHAGNARLEQSRGQKTPGLVCHCSMSACIVTLNSWNGEDLIPTQIIYGRQGHSQFSRDRISALAAEDLWREVPGMEICIDPKHLMQTALLRGPDLQWGGVLFGSWCCNLRTGPFSDTAQCYRISFACWSE